MKKKYFIWISFFACMLFSSPGLAQVNLPEDLKKVVLVYPGADTVKVAKNDMGGRHVYDIDLQIQGAEYKKVVSFYRNETKKRKWKIFSDVDRGYGYILMCHDGRYKIDITVTPKENKILVRLSILGR
ncbi:MAG: hypothetical protein GY795_25870 [Desulfobacterales bacterium]|nr:hypothetical protein [Desulfobacterales bacterium]